MSARRAFDHVMLATRIRHTGKLRRNLRPEERWVYVCVLAIAGEANPRGAFLVAGREPTAADMADEAAVPVSVARRALERIREQGMLEQDDEGMWWVHDFDEHNPAPRNDPGNADRQRRYRERHAPDNAPLRNAAWEGDNAPLRNGGNADEGKRSKGKGITPPLISPPQGAPNGTKSGTVSELFSHWQQQCGHPHAKLTPDRRRKIEGRLREGYTAEYVKLAIDHVAVGAYVNEQGRRFDDIELICRSGSKLEGYHDAAPRPAGGSAVEPATTAEGLIRGAGSKRSQARMSRTARRLGLDGAP